MKLSAARWGSVALCCLSVVLFSLPPAAAVPPASPAAKPTAANLVQKPAAKPVQNYAAPTPPKKLERSRGAVPEKEWTLLYYLDADCNLEPEMLDDMDELETIGSTDNVNIVVLLDRTPEHDPRDGNWANTRLLYVTRDATDGKLKSQMLDNLKEMDTANPQTLVDFIAFGLVNFPAKRHALILGNHGGTWMGMLNDDTNNAGGMKLSPFIQSLEALKKAGAPKFDVIGFDMCLMAQVEVMDAISPYADYGVASEELEPGAGYPNHRVLRELTKNPKMTGREFAATMVREWGASYEEAGEAAVTSSATDLSKIGGVTAAVDALAGALGSADGNVHAAVAEARGGTHYYGGEAGGGDYASFDLGEFASKLSAAPAAAPVRAQVDAVKAAVASAVVEHKEGAAHVGSTGLAIYFPASGDVHPEYSTLPFVRGKWDEFLAQGVVAGGPGGSGGAGGPGAGGPISIAIVSPDPSVTHPVQGGLQVTAQVTGRPAAVVASIAYADGDGGFTVVSQEEVAGGGALQNGGTLTYTLSPSARAVSDGRNSRLVPTTPLTPGSRYLRADASYNSMRGDQKVTTVFDSQTGKLETIFATSEKGARAPMAVHPVKGEKLVFYQPAVSKDKKSTRFRPVPALAASGGKGKGRAKGGEEALCLVKTALPAGEYALVLTAIDAAGQAQAGDALSITIGASGGGQTMAPGLSYPNYGYPAVGYNDLAYVDLTQIIPAAEYGHFEATWSDYDFMYDYEIDDFTAADLAYLDDVALDAAELEFDRADWSDEFDTYSLEHPGDADGDGTLDAEDLDDDEDGLPDAEDLDDDNDGELDSEDDDLDNDGTDDDVDLDDDGDGEPDSADDDDDNDGLSDEDDADDDDGGDAEDDGEDDAEDDGGDDAEDDGEDDAEDDGGDDAEDDGGDDAEDDGGDDAEDDGEDDAEDDGGDDAEDDAEEDGEDDAEDDGGDDAEDDGGDDAEDDAEDDGEDDAEDDGGDDAEDDGGDDAEGDDAEEDDGGGDDGGDDGGGDDGEER